VLFLDVTNMQGLSLATAHLINHSGYLDNALLDPWTFWLDMVFPTKMLSAVELTVGPWPLNDCLDI
jgi:hypothetical protein